ncbi:hypothetical protein BC941DRAFT_410882 [Chlamydoabsidia padenii]|nr:hypothetical protein BC941DRAFT_410882 [Chlamydoabsidia padenii]
MTSIASSPRPAISSPPQDDSQTPHLLSLKVMRLTRPLLATHSPVYYEQQQEKKSSLVEGLEAIHISDLSASHPIESDGPLNIRDFGLGQMLKLPSAFGNIYLGESFSTLVSFNNETGTDTVYDMGAKIELQTSSQRFSLYDTLTTPQKTMLPHTSQDVTVSHEIKELGVHILVCSVHYVTPDGKKRHFRKFYKFQVSNPLAVKTKLNNLADGRVFMEAQVQNVSAGPMYLERMKFEPSEYFDFEDMNQQQQDQQQVSVFGDAFIHPQDIRQYLYLLTPKTSSQNKDRIARTTNALGKLDIVWRSAMGDMGRLQTSQLTRKAPVLEDIEVQPIDATVTLNNNNNNNNDNSAHTTTTTDRIILETPFQLALKVRNHSTQPMHLVLSANKTKMGSVLLSGLSTRLLGDLPSNESTETRLEFFPLTPGLQRVGGLKVVDTITGYTKDVDHLCDVFVLSSPHEDIDKE